MSEPRVHFVRGGSAYLPELDAYRQHLSASGWQCEVHESAATVPAGAGVVWWLCGRVPRGAATQWPGAFHVHEYASASVPPLAWVKDKVKRLSHPAPQHRVFQNEWVRKRLRFADAVPFSERDMGVPAFFLSALPSGPAEFDLVYLGETSRLAAFQGALKAIADAGLTLLVVGSVDEPLRDYMHGLGNVQLAGKMAQQDVPAQLLRARAGLNLMPDRLPFSAQTSTKVLEYLAVGLPVVGNDYRWITSVAREFPQRVRTLDVGDATAWRAAGSQIAPVQQDRSHLSHFTWASRLHGLPVWDALQKWRESQP